MNAELLELEEKFNLLLLKFTSQRKALPHDPFIRHCYNQVKKSIRSIKQLKRDVESNRT